MTANDVIQTILFSDEKLSTLFYNCYKSFIEVSAIKFINLITLLLRQKLILRSKYSLGFLNVALYY